MDSGQTDTGEDIGWLYDYIVQFLKSPGWKTPIMTFIDEHCLVFDSEDENKLEYTQIHDKFKDMVDALLEALIAELGVPPDLFLQAVQKGTNTPVHKRIFDQILACDNFTSFKKLMVRRNMELEKEAMASLLESEAQEATTDPGSNKEKLEMETAVSLSMALEQEKDRERQRLNMQEEEDLKRAMELSEMEYRSTLQKDQFSSAQMEALQSKPALQPPMLRFEDQDEAPSSIAIQSSTPMIFGSIATDSGLQAQEEEAKQIELAKQKQEEEQKAAELEKSRQKEIMLAKQKQEAEIRKHQRMIQRAEEEKKADELTRLEQQAIAEQQALEEQKRIFEEEERKLEEQKRIIAEEKKRKEDELAIKAEESARQQRELEAAEAARIKKQQEEAAIIRAEQEVQAALLAEEQKEAERIAQLKRAEEAEAARIKAEEDEKARQMEEQRKAEQDQKAEKDRRRAERRQKKAVQKLQAEAEQKAREEAQRLADAEDAKLREEQAAREGDRFVAFNAIDIPQATNASPSQKEIEDKKIEDLRRMREEAKNAKKPEEKSPPKMEAWGSPEKSPIKEPAPALPPLSKPDTNLARMTLEELKRGQVNTEGLMSDQVDLLAAAEEISKRNEFYSKKPKRQEESKGKESMQKRQDRLKRQRDMLLLKKKKERDEELTEYSESGGIGAAIAPLAAEVAKKVADQPDDAIFKKRITLAEKIKATLANK